MSLKMIPVTAFAAGQTFERATDYTFFGRGFYTQITRTITAVSATHVTFITEDIAGRVFIVTSKITAFRAWVKLTRAEVIAVPVATQAPIKPRHTATIELDPTLANRYNVVKA